MSGTPTTSRAALPRRFENYTLTRFIGPGAGLTNISDRQFTQAPGNPGQPGFTGDTGFNGVGWNTTAFSVPIPIGFPFLFDGITYDHFVVDVNGWMALVDPSLGTFTWTDVLQSTPASGFRGEYSNGTILSTFTANHVLLAPWFSQLVNRAQTEDQLLGAPFGTMWPYTPEKVTRLQMGLEPHGLLQNYVSYGVSYYYNDRSHKGRSLIVRWSSINNATIQDGSIVKFEVVIYENGKIEFRYDKKNLVTLDVSTIFHRVAASMGIFMPNGTNRFRDFAVGVGYANTSRQEYTYGGYVYDPTYTDYDPYSGFTSYYAQNLNPELNWPGLHVFGAVFEFAPPQRRRKVLPRRDITIRDSAQSYPTIARTGDSRLGNASSFFDDRKTSVFGTTNVVNYPTTLQRFYGDSSAGTLERQNLFTGDFEVTSSTSRNASEQFVVTQNNTAIEPFNESFLHDQDPNASIDPFFAVGTDVNQIAPGFNQSLRSKTQIRVSFPVDYNTQLPATTSSIYYYNSEAHCWEVPVNTTYVLQGSTPPANGSRMAGGDWSDPYADSSQFRVNEDARGFGPIGNVVSSGSRNNANISNEQTDPAINVRYNNSNISTALSKTYTKSVRNNEEYRPADFETFTLPITAPFLIEKAVFEIPIAAGAGWFNDKTQTFIPLDQISGFHADGTQFDFAGPAITVALHRHIVLSRNQSSGSSVSRRDLIITGTIIPATDNFSDVSIMSFNPDSSLTQIRPVGFLSYAGPAGCIIGSTSTQQFTGSAVVKSAALTSVGVIAYYYGGHYSGTSAQNASAITSLMTSNPLLSLKTLSLQQDVRIGSISPFGRGGTGFEQSGRSVLGNEYVTLQGLLDKTGKNIANPFFMSGGLSTSQATTLATAAVTPGFTPIAAAAIPIITHFPEPYLVMPGDKLVLSISKMRPAIYTASPSYPHFTSSLGSDGHDFQLISGTINMTLYGSQVRAGVEFHDPLNQLLASNSIHEIIGAEPVVDQFDVAYAAELSGSMLDLINVERAVPMAFYPWQTSGVLQSMITPLVHTQETQKYFSNLSSLETNSSWSTQNYWSSHRKLSEIKKSSRNTVHVTSDETFWDSRIPDASSIIDNLSPGMVTAASLFSFLDGTLIFTGRSPTYSQDAGGPTGQRGIGDWIMTYPFEPRFSAILPTFSTTLTGKLMRVKLFGVTATEGPYLMNFGQLNVEFGEVSSSRGHKATRTVAGESDGVDWLNGLGMYEFIKFFYGFGDGRSGVDNGHVKFRSLDPNASSVCTELRGWRYGMVSAFPLNTSAVFRRDRYGQMRDMLEQRLDSKFTTTQNTGIMLGSTLVSGSLVGLNQQVPPTVGPVTVRFVDGEGKTTLPEYTMSSNLSTEVTSSLPFFDGVVRNREDPISFSKTNQSLVIVG